MNIAFCIGNGPSKDGFDLKLLNDAGPTYGCNRLIDKFPLDNTVAVDRNVVIDLIARGVRTNIYTRRRWHAYVQADNLQFLSDPIQDPQHEYDREIHWGSGTHALNLAAKTGVDIIVMLGYDIWNADLDPSVWIYQIKKCFELHPNVQFVQIQPSGWHVPEEWTHDNFLMDDFDGLKTLLKDND